jgi:hypothetical protein
MSYHHQYRERSDFDVDAPEVTIAETIRRRAANEALRLSA